MFVISNHNSFVFQNLKVVGALGGKFDFLIPSGFEIQNNFAYEPQKLSSTLSELCRAI